jgi:type I restriction enzyme S subunit
MLNKVRLLKEGGFFDTNMMALTPGNGIDGEYLFYTLSHIGLSSVADVTSIPQINKKHISPFEIPCPSFPERRAIAEALSDVDELLGALEVLIAKKRAIKQAAMQQLLTGKTRLPGFSGGWETRRLGEFAAIRNQKVLPAKVDPETLCVELEHIGQGDGRLFDYSTARHSSSTKYRFLAGDVLFGRLRPYLRKFWHSDRNGICTTEIWPLVADPKQASSSFLRAVVETNRFIDTASASYGTHMPRADWGVMQNFEVRLPGVKEQTAIAAILSDMDAQIAALEARRDKTRAIKQGMMQQLLTGRVRLVKPSPAGAAA